MSVDSTTLRHWVAVPVFLIALTANVSANLLEDTVFEIVTKATLMPILVWHLTLNFTFSNLWTIWTFGVALALAFVGDVALLFEGDVAFAVGMVAFFLTHVLYSVVFVAILSGKAQAYVEVPPVVYRVLIAVSVLVYGVALALAIWLAVTEVAVPLSIGVVVYMVAVAFMACVAPALLAWGVVGALLFAVSDSVLAAKRFLEPTWFPEDRYVEAFIMATYGLAQLLFTQGIVYAYDWHRMRKRQRLEDS